MTTAIVESKRADELRLGDRIAAHGKIRDVIGIIRNETDLFYGSRLLRIPAGSLTVHFVDSWAWYEPGELVEVHR